MFCPNCGSELREGAKFCGQCGAQMPEASAPAAEPAQQTGPAAPEAPAPAAPAAETTESPAAPVAPPVEAPAAPEPPVQPSQGGQPQPEPILRRSHGLLTKQPGTPAPSAVPGEPILTGRKHGLGVIIGLVAAAVAVIAVLALFVVPSVIQTLSPKAYLAACAGKTLASYTEAWAKTGDSIGLRPLYKAAKSDRMEVAMSAKLKEVPGMDALSGAGMDVTAQFDLKGREGAYQFGVQYGSATLGSAQVYLKDDLIALGSPEFTGGKFYGVHTETLGADILSSEWGEFADVPENLSFNIFDLAQMYMDPKSLLDAKTYAALAKETTDLIGDSKVKKEGKQEQIINGENETLKMYTVSLEADDVAEYIVDCTETVLNDKTLYQSLEPVLDLAAVSEYNGSMTSQELFDDWKATTLDSMDEDMIADSLPETMELSFGMRGKEIALAELKLAMGGERVSLSAQLGTKSSLINALTLTMRAGDERITIRSEGNHELDGGVFSDNISVRRNTEEELFRMKTELNTKEKADNFSMSLSTAGRDAVSFSAKGTVDVSSKKLTANLDRVAFEADGEELSFSMDYSLGKCSKFAFSGKDATLITDMTEADLEDLAYDIEDNAQELIYGLIQNDPSLMRLF